MAKRKPRTMPKHGRFYWRVELMAVFGNKPDKLKASRAAGVVDGQSAGEANLHGLQEGNRYFKSIESTDKLQFVRVLAVQRLTPATMPALTMVVPEQISELLKTIGDPKGLAFDARKRDGKKGV